MHSYADATYLLLPEMIYSKWRMMYCPNDNSLTTYVPKLAFLYVAS